MKQDIPNLNQILSSMHVIKQIGSSTEGHSFRVSYLAREFGNHLSLCELEIKRLTIGAFLHDIGKISFSEDLLQSDSQISDSDKLLIHQHPIKGLILINEDITDKKIKEIVLFHHERVDGLGYPFQLKGDEIPYLARVVTLCDSYDAMTGKRQYRPTLSIPEALKEIERCAGSQFDEKLAYKFIEFIKTKHQIIDKNHS